MRAWAAVISIALIVLVASPVLRRPLDDGFPLSTYPMFAAPRPTKQVFDYAYGETATGERRTLTPAVLGTGEVLQAVAMYARAVTVGKKATGPLCQRIAAALATEDRYGDVVRVKIVTATLDAVDYLVRGDRGTEVEQAQCPVEHPHP